MLTCISAPETHGLSVCDCESRQIRAPFGNILCIFRSVSGRSCGLFPPPLTKSSPGSWPGGTKKRQPFHRALTSRLAFSPKFIAEYILAAEPPGNPNQTEEQGELAGELTYFAEPASRAKQPGGVGSSPKSRTSFQGIQDLGDGRLKRERKSEIQPNPFASLTHSHLNAASPLRTVAIHGGEGGLRKPVACLPQHEEGSC